MNEAVLRDMGQKSQRAMLKGEWGGGGCRGSTESEIQREREREIDQHLQAETRSRRPALIPEAAHHSLPHSLPSILSIPLPHVLDSMEHFPPEERVIVTCPRAVLAKTHF